VLDAVGVAGVGFTVTEVVPAAEVQLLTVTVTEYVPASAVVALERVGFCSDDVKPFGPVHEYVAPLTVGVDNEIVAPSQYGPVFDAVGVAGVALTVTEVVPAAEVQPLTVTVTEYVPPSAVVAFERVGFWADDVKPFGPAHEYVAPETVGVDNEIVAPAQYGPVFDADGVDGIGLIVTLAELAAVQVDAVVTVSDRVTLPDAPAVYVTVCAVAPPVIVPFVIDHA